MTHIDWRAVTWCIEGTPMTELRHTERQMVVRRLQHRIPLDGLHPLPGQVTAARIGELLGVTERAVQRTIHNLPLASRNTCPVCAETCWVTADQTTEPHPDKLMEECPLSGYDFPVDVPGVWEARLAAVVRGLAQRMRAGDVEQVRRELCSRPDAVDVALAALATVDAEHGMDWLAEELTEVGA